MGVYSKEGTPTNSYRGKKKDANVYFPTSGEKTGRKRQANRLIGIDQLYNVCKKKRGGTFGSFQRASAEGRNQFPVCSGGTSRPSS